MTSQAASTQPRRGTPWLLIVGGMILLISILLCAVGGITALGPAKELSNAPEQDAPQTVVLEQGESVSVWARQSSGTTCTATGPGGPVSNSAQGSQSMSWGDKSFERVASFEADQAGDHTISCTGPYVIGDGVAVGGIVAAAIGSALCCISVVLVAVGLVLWLRRRRR